MVLAHSHCRANNSILMMTNRSTSKHRYSRQNRSCTIFIRITNLMKLMPKRTLMPTLKLLPKKPKNKLILKWQVYKKSQSIKALESRNHSKLRRGPRSITLWGRAQPMRKNFLTTLTGIRLSIKTLRYAARFALRIHNLLHGSQTKVLFADEVWQNWLSSLSISKRRSNKNPKEPYWAIQYPKVFHKLIVEYRQTQDIVHLTWNLIA